MISGLVFRHPESIQLEAFDMVLFKHDYVMYPMIGLPHGACIAGTIAMATDYDWSRHARIVDVGGAYGSFLAQLLTRNQKPRGVLFDQPQVLNQYLPASNYQSSHSCRSLTSSLCCCHNPCTSKCLRPTWHVSQAVCLVRGR